MDIKCSACGAQVHVEPEKPTVEYKIIVTVKGKDIHKLIDEIAFNMESDLSRWGLEDWDVRVE